MLYSTTTTSTAVTTTTTTATVVLLSLFFPSLYPIRIHDGQTEQRPPPVWEDVVKSRRIWSGLLCVELWGALCCSVMKQIAEDEWEKKKKKKKKEEEEEPKKKRKKREKAEP